MLARHVRDAPHAIRPRQAGQPVVFSGQVKLSPAVAALLAAHHGGANTESDEGEDAADGADNADDRGDNAQQCGRAEPASAGETDGVTARVDQEDGSGVASALGDAGASTSWAAGEPSSDASTPIAQQAQLDPIAAESSCVAATDSEAADASCCATGATGVTQLVAKGTSVTEDGLRRLFLRGSSCRRSLQLIDVSGCAGVTLACLRHLPARSALRTVRAMGCSGITQLSLAFERDCPLQSMALPQCAQLRFLRLNAPRLQSVALQVRFNEGRHVRTHAPRVTMRHARCCCLTCRVKCCHRLVDQ